MEVPKKKEQFSEWYQWVLQEGKFVAPAPVRGCYILKPAAVAVWNGIKLHLNEKITAMGSEEYLFPLFIPRSFLEKEKEHVEGFSPEVALVTHAGGELLEEPLVVRPTSETIIHHYFSQAIVSWRDLPLKVNQWANVVRWEKRSRAFLRSTEFWWQEGHTAHATHAEAKAQVLDSLAMYSTFIREVLAIPLFAGYKPLHERFAGAEITSTIEGMMGDGKALQMATSHLLSSSFATEFSIQFRTKENTLAQPFLTSWGATTRLIGALIMVHGDERGMVMPASIAPHRVSIIPYEEATLSCMKENNFFIGELAAEKISVTINTSFEKKLGDRIREEEYKGTPLIAIIGKKECATDTVTLLLRDTGEKVVMARTAAIPFIIEEGKAQPKRLYEKAYARLQQNIRIIETADDIVAAEDSHFFVLPWCGCPRLLERIKSNGYTVRCLLDPSLFPLCSLSIHSPHTQCGACGEKEGVPHLIAKAY